MRNLVVSGAILLAASGGPVHADRAPPARQVAVLAAAMPATTSPTPAPPPPPRTAAFLEARDVAALVTPHAPQIERCYLDRVASARRGGHLDLTFVIGRDGSIVSLHAAADRLPIRAAPQVEACVRRAVDTLRFPARRNDTTAVVPYYFLKTDAPDAGPQLSCWSPKGC